jgi:phosphatidylglycerophosphatase A
MLLEPEQRRALWRHPAGWIATGAFSGLSPLAPGTAGSFAALLPWLALRELPWPMYLGVLALVFAIGCWACAWVVRSLRVSDPGIAVIDEFVGQWLTLLPLLGLPFSIVWTLLGFVLFRVFDVWKPWPVSWADRRVKGGLGVMLDDVLAGVYAAIVLEILLRLL